MRMTLHSDYALRMLVYLAMRPDEVATASEIAAAYDLSRNHLLKVALNLRKGGFVETTRGRMGGLRLSKPASEMTVGQVVRFVEEDFALVECFRADGGNCVISPACRLKDIFHEALSAYLAVLEKYTLADVVGDRTALSLLFFPVNPAPAGPHSVSAQ